MSDTISGEIGKEGRGVAVGKDIEQASASGNRTTIYFDRDEQRWMNRDTDDMDTRWMEGLARQLNELTTAVVELRIAVNSLQHNNSVLDSQIQELKRANQERSLRDWQIYALFGIIISLGIAIVVLLFILVDGGIK